MQARGFHETGDRAAGDASALAIQRLPSVLGAIDALIRVPASLDRRAQLGLPPRPRWSSCGIALTCLMLVEHRRRHPNRVADGLDNVRRTMDLHQPHHHVPRRSSFASPSSALSPAPARPWSVPSASRNRAGVGGPISAASHPTSRSLPRPTESPPTAIHGHRPAHGPVERPAHAPLRRTMCLLP